LLSTIITASLTAAACGTSEAKTASTPAIELLPVDAEATCANAAANVNAIMRGFMSKQLRALPPEQRAVHEARVADQFDVEQFEAKCAEKLVADPEHVTKLGCAIRARDLWQLRRCQMSESCEPAAAAIGAPPAGG
jgi:hypothetical protein